MKNDKRDLLNDLIRETLLHEDFESFRQATKDMKVYSPPGGRALSDKDRTFEKNPEVKKDARFIKQMWNQHADHSFFKSLIKIHWIGKGDERDAVKSIKNVIKSPGTDEISCGLYLPGSAVYSVWGVGGVGIVVDGRVTLAVGSMDYTLSGYYSSSSALKTKYQSSGIPRYPGAWSQEFLDQYVLDKKDFESKATDRSNEGFVDNWRPKAIVITQKYLHDLKSTHVIDQNTVMPSALWDFISGLNLPVLDENMNPIDEKTIEDMKVLKYKK